LWYRGGHCPIQPRPGILGPRIGTRSAQRDELVELKAGIDLIPLERLGCGSADCHDNDRKGDDQPEFYPKGARAPLAGIRCPRHGSQL
jgi:hypothetical protein